MIKACRWALIGPTYAVVVCCVPQVVELSSGTVQWACEAIRSCLLCA